MIIEGDCIREALGFLELADFNRFSIYRDTENLASWIRNKRMPWIDQRKQRY